MEQFRSFRKRQCSRICRGRVSAALYYTILPLVSEKSFILFSDYNFLINPLPYRAMGVILP